MLSSLRTRYRPAHIRPAIHGIIRRLGYSVVDHRKDVGAGILLPGHLRKTIERLSLNCVVDVGANRGDYAAMLRKQGFTGLILSVEPLRDVYEALAQRAASDPNWRVLNAALGDKDEFRQINVCVARNLSSFLSPAGDIGEAVLDSEVEAVETVHVRRLDEVLRSIVREEKAPRVLLKMDTQGYDLRVMEGAVEVLPFIRAIQTELSVVPLYRDMPDYVEALSYFRKLGFAPTGFFGVTGHLRTGRTLEFDAILTRLDAK